jgi:polyhydroxyalkanoate synthesis regulator phasin
MPPAKRAATSAKTKTPAKKDAGSKTTRAGAGSGTAKGRSKASEGKAGLARATSKAADTKAGSQVEATKAAASKAAETPATTAKPATTRNARTASPATARRSGTSAQTKRTDGARAAAARVKHAASTDAGVISIAEQLVKGSVSPKDVVMLTREHIQETLDDAASRGRVTRKDANELVAELVRRGRSGGDDIRSEIEGMLGKRRGQIESVTKRAVRSQPVDRIVRGADRARRAAGVGSSFPISGYPDLNVSQVQTRLKELSKPELRKVLTYERNHANRKSVVGAIQKSL